MMSAPRLSAALGLLMLCMKGACGGGGHESYPLHNTTRDDTTISHLPPILSTITTVTQPSCTNITEVPRITTTTVTQPDYITITEVTTTTELNYTTISTGTTVTLPPNTTTTTTTATNSTTLYSSVTTTTTDSTTLFSSSSTTITLPPDTTTTTDSTTLYSSIITTVTPTFNPCPTTCSMYAGTVNLFYWPTSNDYSYPSTYVHTALDYTFTSPSVYMVINTFYGTNSAGRAGPAASSPVFAADLNEVSTIVPGGDVTRQLTLNDLGTNCPQSMDPTEIATMIPEGRCDPILVAPNTVKSWASPCNACGRFGLFDPPYAVPTLSGGLIETTATITTVESTIKDVPPPTTPPSTWATSRTVTETINPPPDTTPTEEPDTSTVAPPIDEPDTSTAANPTDVPDAGTTTTNDQAPTSATESDPITVPTAAATRASSGLACLLLGLLVSVGLV